MLCCAVSARGADVDAQRLLNAAREPANWLTYHGNYQAWHYSALDQINAANAHRLRVAWSHVAGRAQRGLHGMPLAVDGVVYYSAPFNQVYALNGETGQLLWRYRHKLNEELVTKHSYSPYNRGLAIAHGMLFMGTLDGKVIAIDAQSGQLRWETRLLESEAHGGGFTGAPLVVRDKVIIGAQGGEWRTRGPIFALQAKSGDKLWQFYTVGGNDGTESDRRDTWGNESWRGGGGGGWMTGSYDAQSNTLWWGTGNPLPTHDWSGEKWLTEGARPGANLYSSSIVMLDPDSGKLKNYFQVIPHDTWGYDAAAGDLLHIDRGGRKYVVHPNKSGFVLVFDRQTGKLANTYAGVDNITFASAYDVKTSALLGRRDIKEGKQNNICPATVGGFAWNAGSYSPKTGLLYKVGFEWCNEIELTRAPNEATAQNEPALSAQTQVVAPRQGGARGHIRAREPVSGRVVFEIPYKKAPPLGALLSTAGNLLFVPEADGWLRAYNAANGQALWSHNNGLGHNGGAISYSVKGKQYIAVMVGWGGVIAELYGELWGEPWLGMPRDAGVLKVFALE